MRFTTGSRKIDAKTVSSNILAEPLPLLLIHCSGFWSQNLQKVLLQDSWVVQLSKHWLYPREIVSLMPCDGTDIHCRQCRWAQLASLTFAGSSGFPCISHRSAAWVCDVIELVFSVPLQVCWALQLCCISGRIAYIIYTAYTDTVSVSQKRPI